MIHWFFFNFLVILVSLSLIFDVNNGFIDTLAWILLIIAIILIIKDMFIIRG